MIAHPPDHRTLEIAAFDLDPKEMFEELLKNSIEESLRRPGSTAVTIFRDLLLESGLDSHRCSGNANVRLSHFERNPIQSTIPNGWMLTAILTQADPEGHLCVVLVPESIVIPSDDSPDLMNNFQAKCVGCGRCLESYAEFCEHFRINPNFPKEHVFQYFGQMDSDSMLIRADLLVRIPWSQSRSGQPTIAESPSRSNICARPTQQGNSDGEQRIPVDQLAPMGSPAEINPIQHVIEVPEGILASRPRGHVALLNCTGTQLSYEDSYGTLLESNYLQSCFEFSTAGRTIFTRECMIFLTCYEICQLEKGSLLRQEQIRRVFSKTCPEIQRTLDSGILFPNMLMSISHIVSATASGVKVMTSEQSMSHCVEDAFRLLSSVEDSSRPQFILCIYQGPRKEFLILSTSEKIITSLENEAPIDVHELSTSAEILALKSEIHSLLPQVSDAPKAVLPKLEPGAEKIVLELMDSTSREAFDGQMIAKACEMFAECFNRCFGSNLERFKCFHGMFIVPDDQHVTRMQEIAPNQSPEVLSISVFERAFSGIVEYIDKHPTTLFNFFILGVNSEDYNLEVFKRLDLLSQRAQVMVSCFGIRPYELFASGSPIPPTNVIVPRLSDGLIAASYDFESHLESLSTDSPTVSASPEFENLYSLYLKTTSANADFVRMVVLLELCYVSALLSIEHNGLYESVDPRSLELLRQVVYQKRPVLLRVRDANFATAAYDTLNAALSRQNFQVAKIAVAIWDKSGIQMNDASKRALGLSQSYQCRDIIEIANKPIIIVHYDTVSGMTPTRMPLFAYIDCRLMLTGFFTRKDLEDEFHFATCFMKKKTRRTRDELMAIAGLGMIKRSGDSMSSDDECSPEKRLKVDDSDYMIDFESIRKPPRVLLSSEAFGVFQGKRGFDFRNLTPSKTCARLSETLSLEPESLDMKYLHKYYNTTCTHNEELDTRENYFLLVTPVGFNQIACAFELASTLSHQIQSQFSINIVDDGELNLNLTGQNFALLKKNDFDMSPIMNTLSDAHAVEYIDRKNQLALEDPKTAKIDIGEVSISGSSSRIEPVEPNVPWPIELNIPQLGPNAVTVEIVIPNDKRRRFEFGGMNDANGLKAVRLAIASTRTQSPSPKTIVVSFGLSGAQSGLYDLRKTMKMGDAEFTHLIVVRKNDVNKYREYWPNSCLLVMGAEFDNHGIGCMKLFALRLLQHSWALSPPDCWPFVFFLSDQVAQFRSWSNESRSWDPIPLHDVLLDLESQIASSETDVAMLGLRPWTTADGPPPEDRQFSNRLVQGCYMLNLKYNNISMDHSKYEGEDIDFCLRQVAAGNSCIVLENYGYVEKHNPRSKVLPFEIAVPVSRYVTTEEDSENIKAPGFYLLNEYFKHEGKSIFTDASGTNPVLISGKYINFGKQVPVQILGVSPCQSRPFSGLVICELQPVASSVPTQQELSALSFVPQAKIVVVAADSGRLRQSIRKFGLDKEWEFSLLHEFATANETHAKLYFITGMRRP